MNESREGILWEERGKKATSLPEFSYEKIIDILRRIEKNGKPKNLSEAVTLWTEILKDHMQYDAINFAIFRGVPLDEKQGDFSDKVDPSKLWISEKQRAVLKKTFLWLEKQIEKTWDPIMEEIITNILVSINKEGSLGIVEAIMGSPTIQRYLLEDGAFSHEWHSLYQKKNIQELLSNGVGSCKTFSVMSKMVLESANIRYGLWIKKIEVIENSGFHVFLRIHTSSGIVEYDPTSIVYKIGVSQENTATHPPLVKK